MSNQVFCLLTVPVSAYLVYHNLGIIHQGAGKLRWMHGFLALAWAADTALAIIVAAGLL